MDQLKQIIKLALQTQADKISLKGGSHPIYYIKGEKKEANHLPILDLQLINDFFAFLYPDEKNTLVKSEPTENILSISSNLKLKVLAWNNQQPWIYLYFPNGEWLFQRDFQKALKDNSGKSNKNLPLSPEKKSEEAPPPPPMLHVQSAKIDPILDEAVLTPQIKEDSIHIVQNENEAPRPSNAAANQNSFSLNAFSLVYDEQTEIQGLGETSNQFKISPTPKPESKKQDALNINFFAPEAAETSHESDQIEEKVIPINSAHKIESLSFTNDSTSEEKILPSHQENINPISPNLNHIDYFKTQENIALSESPAIEEHIAISESPAIEEPIAISESPAIEEPIAISESSTIEESFAKNSDKKNSISSNEIKDNSFAALPLPKTIEYPMNGAINIPSLSHLHSHSPLPSHSPLLEKKLIIEFGAEKEGLSQGEHAIDKLLKQMIEIKASDLHLTNGQPIILRVDGDIKRVSDEIIDAEQMQKYLFPIMPLRNQEEFSTNSDTDFAYEVAGTGRFRVNMFRDRNGVGAVLRHIPSKILSFEDLKLPAIFKKFCDLSKGLVLVTGPTGSGKSTTLAAMLDLINLQKKTHIITIEDPIEFVHTQKSALINQREIGRHTQSFSRALRAALREDPDIVLIGEMRDLETIAIAIETAETGHLVFGTLHTNTAISTVDRIIDQFPPEQQNQIRMMLSASLKGVISQTLVKKKGGGRVAAYEILIVDDAISANIREGKTHMIANMMTTQKAAGNQMLNDALLSLVESGVIEAEDAYIKCVDKKDFINKAERRNLKIPGLSNGHAA